MTGQAIRTPFPTFFDSNGETLENGYIYIGTAGLNPETNPIAVYYDKALTIPAVQPIRTLNGFPVNGNTPIGLYTAATSYSIKVNNKNGELIFSELSVDLSISSSLLSIVSTEVFSFPNTVVFKKASDVASAAALPIVNDGNYVDITGTNAITSINTIGAGTWMLLQFDGSLTLTHHATNLILPSGENIVTEAGDHALIVEYATGQWRCAMYTKANGLPVNVFRKGADVVSEAALFTSAGFPGDGNYVDVTGVTAITSIITSGHIGTIIKLHFDGALTLTHHATDLILPGATDIPTAAGDEAEFIEYASGDWRCTSYQRASKRPDTGKIVQTVNTQTGAVATGTTVVPKDDTIMQNTEGDEYMTLAITPTKSTNKLRISVNFYGSNSANARVYVGLFQDSTADALAVASSYTAPGDATMISFEYEMVSGTTSATTFKVRAGGILAGTTTFNGEAGARLFGGVLASSIIITEIEV